MSIREKLALFIFMVFCGYMGMNTEFHTAAPRASGPVYKTFAELQYEDNLRQIEATNSVRRSLIDPDSARFRGVINGLENAVCGLVNSRNRMGGYVGFRHFIVTRTGTTFEGAPDFRGLYVRYCFNDVTKGRSTGLSIGLARAEAAPRPDAAASPTMTLAGRVERWAKVYMPYPVKRVEVQPAGTDGMHEVLIEMELSASLPLTLSMRVAGSIGDSALKQAMIAGSMVANDAMLRRGR